MLVAKGNADTRGQHRGGCNNEYCPCQVPGPVCEQWMGLVTGDKFCPRCGWDKAAHMTEDDRA